MRLNEFQILSPYAFLFESQPYAVEGLEQNRSCVKCASKDCLISLKDLSSFKCNRGLWSFIIETNNQNIFIINGLIFNNEADAQILKYKGRYVVTRNEIERFIAIIKKFDGIIENRIINTIEENFSVFHDIKTTAITVTNCAEKLIGKNEGKDFEDKLSNSAIELIDLYDSISLMRDHLNMIDILVNTNKIKYAKKRPINVYRLFERIAKIFRNNTERKRLQIHWHDNGRIQDVLLYPSFQFIPIVLLDNAIKYSNDDRLIEIGIYEYPAFLKIKVSSFGDFVFEGEEDKIFEKFFKGSNAKGKEGIGMGLWIADQICKAHNGSIKYEKNGFGKYGQNVFTVEIPRINQ